MCHFTITCSQTHVGMDFRSTCSQANKSGKSSEGNRNSSAEDPEDAKCNISQRDTIAAKDFVEGHILQDEGMLLTTKTESSLSSMTVDVLAMDRSLDAKNFISSPQMADAISQTQICMLDLPSNGALSESSHHHLNAMSPANELYQGMLKERALRVAADQLSYLLQEENKQLMHQLKQEQKLRLESENSLFDMKVSINV